MEAVIFDGKEYVKASVVAERFSYTQDYLGQLCRGKKVDARLVGRAWYINLDSLTGHKKTRYKGPDKPAKESEKVFATHSSGAKEHYLSRIDVEPVLKKKTVKIIKNEAGKLSELPVKYESDDYSLIPRISREAVFKPLFVQPADADDIQVTAPKESTRITSFKAEPLPEIYLKGVLSVDGIPEVTEDILETFDEKKTLKHPPEAPHQLIAKDENRPNPLVEHKEVVAADTRRTLKIKLYRNGNAAKPTVTESAVLHKPNIKNAPASIDHHLPLPQHGALKRSIRVEKVTETQLKAHSSSDGFQKPPKKVEYIPFATTKALFLLLGGIICAGSILMIHADVLLDNKEATTVWTFSPEKIQSAFENVRGF